MESSSAIRSVCLGWNKLNFADGAARPQVAASAIKVFSAVYLFEGTDVRIRIVRALIAPLLLAAVSLCAGCSDKAAGLTLTSLRDNHKFADTFTKAYAARNDNGDMDVVLVDDATQRSVTAGTLIGPVHQIMHIRILWSPSRDMKSDDPAASNASIHWYVMGVDRTQMIEYSGTAFVYAGTTLWGNQRKLRIDNARLKPAMARGDLKDPIGPARVEGTIYATDNDQIVNHLLAEVQTTVADTR